MFWNLTGTESTEDLQKIEREISPVLARHGSEIFLDAKMLARIEALSQATQSLYAAAKSPLTINGIHLNAAGDAALAPVQFQAVFGKAAGANTPGLIALLLGAALLLLGFVKSDKDDPKTLLKGAGVVVLGLGAFLFFRNSSDLPTVNEKVRAEVNEKSTQWHHRYRTVDQFNIFGQRSRIKYEGIDNATVLDNLMLGPDGSVTVVDWQTLTVGLPGRDLAYWITTSVSPDLRREVERFEAHVRAGEDHGSDVHRGMRAAAGEAVNSRRVDDVGEPGKHSHARASRTFAR